MSEYEVLARNVVRHSLRIRPKENVIVECWNHGIEVAREFVYELRAAGARPLWLFEDEPTYWRSIETLPTTKLGQVSKSEWSALSAADAYIFLPGPADITRYKKNLPKSGAATAYNAEWYRRAEKAGLRGARVLLGYVTQERAASYGLDHAAWRSMILDAGSADFRAIARRGRRLQALLSKPADVEVTAPNGTRLTFALKGRRATLDDGIVDAEDLKAGDFMTNVPPGYVQVLPDESSADGTIVFDQPEPYLGTFLPGLRMEFRDGRASWSAVSGEEVLRGMWDKAKGPKDRLGGILLGLNPAARLGFLQSDIVAGGFSLWIGSNEEEGGRNKTDFALSGHMGSATVRVGKRLVLDHGRLVS